MAFHFIRESLGDVSMLLKSRDNSELFSLDEAAYFVLASAFSMSEIKNTAEKLIAAIQKKRGEKGFENMPGGDIIELLYQGKTVRTSMQKLWNEPGDRCVAIFLSGGCAFIAANHVWWSNKLVPYFAGKQKIIDAQQTIKLELIKSFGFKKVIYVEKSKQDASSYHAEMQLLSYIIENKYLPDPRYFGVSKPCCQFCGARLNEVGIAYALWHKTKGNDPNLVYPNEPHMDKKERDLLKKTLSEKYGKALPVDGIFS